VIGLGLIGCCCCCTPEDVVVEDVAGDRGGSSKGSTRVTGDEEELIKIERKLCQLRFNENYYFETNPPKQYSRQGVSNENKRVAGSIKPLNK
jgi:hypothetical protein